MQDKKIELQKKIDEAWVIYNELHEAEADTGYADAMDGFERKEAEGFAMGLESAYYIIFNEAYETPVEMFDPYAEEN